MRVLLAASMMKHERVLVLAAVVGVIAVHVIDDSFIQPNDGTSPGDHLAGGLVPLIAIGLAARRVPHLREARAGGEDLNATYYESAGRPKFLWKTDKSPAL